jgi:prepilin-type N-terminal cleavage/methylation domain-containing protein
MPSDWSTAMDKQRARLACTRASRHAFTLIELLVTIAVIGVLIGILMTALTSARDRARDAVCLSNHRQFAVAWGAYFADWDNFPIVSNTHPGLHRVAWGGVDFYPEDVSIPSMVGRERPLNKYLGAPKRETARNEVFMCPRDDSMYGCSSGALIDWANVFGHKTLAEEGTGSIYGMVGTSYAANEWLICHPRATRGIGPAPDYAGPSIEPRTG